jgi:hypothetical protein
MLLDWMRHAQAYGKEANGLILRKELIQLKDLIKESIRVYTPLGGGDGEKAPRRGRHQKAQF